jgi:N-acetyl-anhydromuramyl-L-alanine amidase AmpD
MRKLIFCGNPVIDIAWDKVLTFKDPGSIDGYTKVSVKTPAHTETTVDAKGVIHNTQVPATYKADPAGKFRHGVRPWKETQLRDEIRAVVMHHSVTYNTRDTNRVLIMRGLSLTFGIDDDGTIHQLMDIKERDTSSSTMNDRGISVEVANVVEPPKGFSWAKPPKGYEKRAIIEGPVHGVARKSWAYTGVQLEACGALAAALCAYFPRMTPAWPGVWDNSLRDEVTKKQRWGIVGHLHFTSKAPQGKWDPNPAFPFKSVVREARKSVAKDVLPRLIMGNAATQDVQRGLQALGYELESGADGKAGKETDAACALFMKEQGLADQPFRNAYLVDALKLLLQEV